MRLTNGFALRTDRWTPFSDWEAFAADPQGGWHLWSHEVQRSLHTIASSSGGEMGACASDPVCDSMNISRSARQSKYCLAPEPACCTHPRHTGCGSCSHQMRTTKELLEYCRSITLWASGSLGGTATGPTTSRGAEKSDWPGRLLRSVYHGSVWEMSTCGAIRRNWGDRCMGLKGPTDGMDKPVSPGRPGAHPRLASLPPDRIVQAWLALRFVHSPSGLCPLSDPGGRG